MGVIGPVQYHYHEGSNTEDRTTACWGLKIHPTQFSVQLK